MTGHQCPLKLPLILPKKHNDSPACRQGIYVIMIKRFPGMDSDKRKGMKPVPDKVEEVLNQDQIRALRAMEQFGWQLHFVRRPLFQEVVPVMINQEGDKMMILEADGSLNDKVELDLRDCTPAPGLMKKTAD
jgi:hypothetical protein